MKKIFKKTKTLLFIILTLVVSPVLFVLSQLRHKNKEGHLKILVIPQLLKIGDIICSTPVFRSIKIKYPNSYLAVLSSSKASGIIKNNPHINEIIDFDNYSLLGLAMKLRKCRFDWSFCLSGVSVFSCLVLLGLVKNRVKVTRRERPITEIFTDWTSSYRFVYEYHTFIPAHYLKLLCPIGIKNQLVIKEVFTSAESDKKVFDFFRNKGIKNGDLVIGISLTAGNKIKEWGDAKFADVAQKISERYKAKLIFIGSKNDKSRILELIRAASNKNFFAATNFLIEDLPSLIKRFNLFIAVDTGPIHIAHALEVPLVDIAGPVDCREQQPEDDLSVLVKPPLSISPSLFAFKKPGTLAEGKMAVNSISVSDVLSAVEKLILKMYNI